MAGAQLLGGAEGGGGDVVPAAQVLLRAGERCYQDHHGREGQGGAESHAEQPGPAGEAGGVAEGDDGEDQPHSDARPAQGQAAVEGVVDQHRERQQQASTAGQRHAADGWIAEQVAARGHEALLYGVGG